MFKLNKLPKMKCILMGAAGLGLGSVCQSKSGAEMVRVCPREQWIMKKRPSDLQTICLERDLIPELVSIISLIRRL